MKVGETGMMDGKRDRISNDIHAPTPNPGHTYTQ